MNSLKLMLVLVLAGSGICTTAWAQADLHAQSDTAIDKISVLQGARQAGLPEAIEPSSAVYLNIQELGKSKVNTQQAISELGEWLFVKQYRHYTTEKYTLLDVHPAARSLIAIGAEAAPLLKGRLNATISNDDAVLILRCLQHIYKNDSANQLQQIKSNSTSPVVRQAVDFVLGEPKETTPVQSKLELEN